MVITVVRPDHWNRRWLRRTHSDVPTQEARDKMKAEIKDSNPKDRIGSTKLPLDLLSGIAKVEWCLAQLEGALKYGTWNWRHAGVRVSIYVAAIERHLEKYKNGEDRDPETGVHHLGNVMAGAAILLDAGALSKLTDDRPPMGPAATLIDAAQSDVLHLQRLYGNVQPRNYTIEDSEWEPENNPRLTTISTTELQKLRNRERLATRRVAKLKKKVLSLKAMARK